MCKFERQPLFFLSLSLKVIAVGDLDDPPDVPVCTQLTECLLDTQGSLVWFNTVLVLMCFVTFHHSVMINCSSSS